MLCDPGGRVASSLFMNFSVLSSHGGGGRFRRADVDHRRKCRKQGMALSILEVERAAQKCCRHTAAAIAQAAQSFDMFSLEQFVNIAVWRAPVVPQDEGGIPRDKNHVTAGQGQSHLVQRNLQAAIAAQHRDDGPASGWGIARRDGQAQRLQMLADLCGGHPPEAHPPGRGHFVFARHPAAKAHSVEDLREWVEHRLHWHGFVSRRFTPSGRHGGFPACHALVYRTAAISWTITTRIRTETHRSFQSSSV